MKAHTRSDEIHGNVVEGADASLLCILVLAISLCHPLVNSLLTHGAPCIAPTKPAWLDPPHRVSCCMAPKQETVRQGSGAGTTPAPPVSIALEFRLLDLGCFLDQGISCDLFSDGTHFVRLLRIPFARGNDEGRFLSLLRGSSDVVDDGALFLHLNL